MHPNIRSMLARFDKFLLIISRCKVKPNIIIFFFLDLCRKLWVGIIKIDGYGMHTVCNESHKAEEVIKNVIRAILLT